MATTTRLGYERRRVQEGATQRSTLITRKLSVNCAFALLTVAMLASQAVVSR